MPDLSPAALLAQMKQAGVTLWLEGGRLRYGGNREAIGQWLSVISQHRAALTEALDSLPPDSQQPHTPADPVPPLPGTATQHPAAQVFRHWRVQFPDSNSRDVFSSPPCDLAEMQATYPDAASLTPVNNERK